MIETVLEMLPVVLLFTAFGGASLAAVLSEFPKARPWRIRREQLMQLAQENGLGVEADAQNCTARGELQGRPFAMGICTEHGSKSKAIKLWARLKLDGCPEGLVLAEESLLSGIGRVFGTRESKLGDPEIDAVFTITGQSSPEEVKCFLSPPVRKALLEDMTRLRRARVVGGWVVSEQVFFTPFWMRQHFRPLLEGFRQLATTLDGQTSELVASPVERKLRTFAARSLLLWTPLFLLSLFAVDSGGSAEVGILRGGLFLLIAPTIAVYRGSEMGRVLLQGVYAFFALATASLTVLGVLEFAELVSWRLLRLSEDNAFPFFLVSTLATLLLWGARHYLKVLDSSLASRRGF